MMPYYLEEMQKTIEKQALRLKILLDENKSLRLSRALFALLALLALIFGVAIGYYIR